MAPELKKLFHQKTFGLSALSQGHEVEEATECKHVKPGETETVEEPMVSTNDDV